MTTSGDWTQIFGILIYKLFGGFKIHWKSAEKRGLYADWEGAPPPLVKWRSRFAIQKFLRLDSAARGRKKILRIKYPVEIGYSVH